MILREMLAVFGLDYDGKGQQKAERGLQALRSQTESLQMVFGQMLTAGAVAAPFLYLTKLASDAQENMNLLELAFGDNAKEIEDWSNQVGPAIGRSRYTLRELAAEFGGLLQPMVGTGDKLAEMSKGLTKLAVDLSSARNVTENEALSALQSGLTGNIIALKRFGVDLNQTRVQSEAMARGLSKNTKELSQGELAAIRYDIIMKDLAFIEGDAANTQDQFANSTRAARDALKDIGTDLGFFFLPAFEESLLTTRKILEPLAQMVRRFTEFAKSTNLAKASVMTLSLIMAAMLLPLFMKIIPFILMFGLFVVIMDDVITTFQGGNSVIGEFTKALDGLEKEGFPGVAKGAAFAMWAFNRLRDGIGAVMTVLWALWEGISTGNFADLRRMVDDVKQSFLEWKDSLGKWGKAIFAFLGLLMAPLVAMGGVISGIIEAITTGSVAPLKGVLSGMKGMMQDPAKDFGALFSPSAQKFTAAAGGGGALGAASGATLDQAGLQSRNVSIQQGNKTITLNIQQQPGEHSEDFAQRVIEIMDSHQEQMDQEINADLVQVGAY